MPEFTTLTPSRPLRRVPPVLFALPLAPAAFVFFAEALRTLFADADLAALLRDATAADFFAALRGAVFLPTGEFFFLVFFLIAISRVYHRR